MPALFQIQTSIQKPTGGQFSAPFRVAENTLEAFVERLAEDGIAIVEQLTLSPPDRFGERWIMSARKMALWLSAVLTIQTFHGAVRERPQSEAA